jgi:predicted dehydrogenase
MLRLAVVGGEWGGLTRRLRGATLDADARPEDCDAVIALEGEQAVERALAAGKHVLLADESLLTAERLTAWSALVRPGGPQLAVLNRDLFLPSRQLIRQQIETHLGRPGLVRVHRWAAFASPAHLIRDLGVVVSFMGHGPDVVCALAAKEGIVQVHLGFPGGGMAFVDHATGPAFGEGYSSLSVIASSGAAYADDHADRQLRFAGGNVHALRTDEDVLALAAMVQAFVDAVSAGADLSPDLTAWRRILNVRDAIASSLKTGRAVRLEGS